MSLSDLCPGAAPKRAERYNRKCILLKTHNTSEQGSVLLGCEQTNVMLDNYILIPDFISVRLLLFGPSQPA